MPPEDRRILLVMGLKLVVGPAVVFPPMAEPVMQSQSSLFDYPSLP